MAQTKIKGMAVASYKRLILKEEYPGNLIKAIIGASKLVSPAEITSETRAGLEDAISTLSHREQNLLHLRYKDRKTLKEISVLFYVTPGRVRQVESAALRHLRKPERLQKIIQHTHDTKGVML